MLHRLVALAWVKNSNHLKYYLVNHKDGNKHNPNYKNLKEDEYRFSVMGYYDTNKDKITDSSFRFIKGIVFLTSVEKQHLEKYIESLQEKLKK